MNRKPDTPPVHIHTVRQFLHYLPDVNKMEMLDQRRFPLEERQEIVTRFEHGQQDQRLEEPYAVTEIAFYVGVVGNERRWKVINTVYT